MAQHKDTIASEVLSASVGGAISASILFPLEVLKTKMQAADDDDEDKESMVQYSKKLYEKDGISVFFNGIETSAFQSAMEKAFYFFAYTALKQVHSFTRTLLVSPQEAAKPLGTLTNLALGCLAEWAHLPVTMPIDCLSTAIQTSKQQNAVALMMTILKEGNMYKGIQAYYVLCFKPALQYTVFEQVKGIILQNRKQKSLSAPEAFLLGMVARTVATVAVFPFVRAKVVMQSRKKSKQHQNEQPKEDVNGDGGDGGDGDIKGGSDGDQQNENQSQQPSTTAANKDDESVWTLLKEMYESGGLAALYQGLGPELTRGVFSAALMLMIKEKINGGIKTALYGPPPSTRSSGRYLRK